MKKKYHRVGFSAAQSAELQSAELWDRWRAGESLSAIGREFGKPSSSIFAHVRPTGGISPIPRRRSRWALTLAEREEISRGLVAGQSIRAIARLLALPGSGGRQARLETGQAGEAMQAGTEWMLEASCCFKA
jgi:IS30 family transposase